MKWNSGYIIVLIVVVIWLIIALESTHSNWRRILELFYLCTVWLISLLLLLPSALNDVNRAILAGLCHTALAGQLLKVFTFHPCHHCDFLGRWKLFLRGISHSFSVKSSIIVVFWLRYFYCLGGTRISTTIRLQLRLLLLLKLLLSVFLFHLLEAFNLLLDHLLRSLTFSSELLHQIGLQALVITSVLEDLITLQFFNLLVCEDHLYLALVLIFKQWNHVIIIGDRHFFAPNLNRLVILHLSHIVATVAPKVVHISTLRSLVWHFVWVMICIGYRLLDLIVDKFRIWRVVLVKHFCFLAGI